MLKKILRSHSCFAALLAVLVLYELLLLSGYILTLDMVFGPIGHISEAGVILNLLPIEYLHLFSLNFMNGWLIQKIFISAIFFGLLYLPLRYFKKIFPIQTSYGAEYVTALVLAINPFVYERFLAGQWQVLAGYALLVPCTAYALEFCRKPSRGVLVRLSVTMLCLGAVSIHFFMIVGILMAGLWLWTIVTRQEYMQFLKYSIGLGLILLCGSSYWLLPAVVGDVSPLETFTPEHYEVFRTAADPLVGVIGNVIALHGFWGEHEPWIERFVVPKSLGVSFWVALCAMLSLVVVGIYGGLRRTEWRIQTITLSVALVVSVVLSAGVGGEGWIRGVNAWLFENVSFWKGFRDTQKWSGVIALVYALFAGLGAYHLLSSKWGLSYRCSVLMVCMSLPLICTPMILFGFAGQLQTVHYPENWAKVNEVLQQDKSCKALFLPWHQYYSLKFNNDLLTANVSASYFDCTIVHGKNMELGSIESQGGNGEIYELIEKNVITNDGIPEASIELLRNLGIKYVIFTDDLLGEDDYSYPFLQSKSLQKLIDEGEIVLFKIN